VLGVYRPRIQQLVGHTDPISIYIYIYCLSQTHIKTHKECVKNGKTTLGCQNVCGGLTELAFPLVLHDFILGVHHCVNCVSGGLPGIPAPDQYLLQSRMKWVTSSVSVEPHTRQDLIDFGHTGFASLPTLFISGKQPSLQSSLSRVALRAVRSSR